MDGAPQRLEEGAHCPSEARGGTPEVRASVPNRPWRDQLMGKQPWLEPSPSKFLQSSRAEQRE